MGTPSLKLDLSSYSISLGNPVATSLAATKGEGKSDESDPNGTNDGTSAFTDLGV